MHAVVQQSLFVSWIIRWCQDILSISIVVNPLRVLSVLCCFDDLLTSQRSIRRTDVGVCTYTLPQTSTTHTKLHPVHLVHTHKFYLVFTDWGAGEVYIYLRLVLLMLPISLCHPQPHTRTFAHSPAHTHTQSVVHQMACMNDDLSQLQILNQGVISWIPEVFLFVYRQSRV